jgi:RHS repeat-associated protein
MLAAAKERSLQPHPGLLAPLTQNSHQGLRLSTAVSHPAFGPAISQTPTGLANHLYDFGVGPRCSGYFRDAESGNDYADQRYASPGFGRFITPDRGTGGARPSNPGSWNKYAYVGGDPVNRVDPGGTDECEVAGAQDCYCAVYGDTDPNCNPNYCPAGICGTGGAPTGQSGPSCQEQVIQDVISDRATQIGNQMGNLDNILVSGFSFISDLSTVAGQGATETETVLQANSAAAMTTLLTFLNNSGLFSSSLDNFLVGGPGGDGHAGYTGNYRQNVLFNSMQIETIPAGQVPSGQPPGSNPFGQIEIDIDPINPAAVFPIGVLGHFFGQVLPNKISGGDTNYAGVAQQLGFSVPNCP